MIATSAHRVAEQTGSAVNEQIRRTTDMTIAYFAAHPEEIDQRLDELDQEWDIERMLQLNAAALSMFGLVMGIVGRSRWLLLPLAVQGFFLQHAFQGWCPPVELLRRMGFRTPAEIESERYALKAIRGDFQGLDAGDSATAESRADRVLSAIRGESQRAQVAETREVGAKKRKRRTNRIQEVMPEETAESELGMSEQDVPQQDIGPTS